MLCEVSSSQSLVVGCHHCNNRARRRLQSALEAISVRTFALGFAFCSSRSLRHSAAACRCSTASAATWH
eukprot:4754940-Alexandrium_andersonii.AAC.1